MPPSCRCLSRTTLTPTCRAAVAVEVWDGPPAQQDPAGWDEQAEADFESVSGEVAVSTRASGEEGSVPAREAAVMDSVLTSLVVIFGTLAGSTLTFVFQRRIARQSERFSQSRQLWNERTAAYSELAASLTEFRRSQNDRWHLEQEDPTSSEFIKAREESYQRRAEATAALCRVRLLCGSSELRELAQEALDTATEVHLARDEHDRAERGRAARLALDTFLARGANQLL